MADPVPQRITGTTVEYKLTSGGAYAAIKKCFSRQIPTPKRALDDTTGIEDDVVTMDPTVVDYGDCVLSILYDPANADHAALYTAAANGDTVWLRITDPSGRLTEFSGPAYEFGDKTSGPKDHKRNDYKQRCNVVPTFTEPA